jgi:hypothetical protein
MDHPESDLKRSSFLISKWYMDCVAEDGAVFIGYAARMRWRSLSFNYASTLRQVGDQPASVQTSIAKSAFPVQQETSIQWRSDSLKTTGTWTPISTPIEQTILTSDVGSVEWRCLAPLAHATITSDDGAVMTGLGYCEHILISISPWQMPIDELRWGRFLSRNVQIVWIDLRGPETLTFVFENGRRVETAVVTDDAVYLGDEGGTLTFSESRVLRAGPIAGTALSSAPLIANLLTSSGLMIDETKWCSRGTLDRGGGDTESGWAIHEVVRWIR